ncbi:dihydrolipoamide acetyltransferase family protein [Leucobacter sp. UT-8R-CII-1-4]|uniref:dihydrolipoamide acetyltransferase family protein n=1 Tax=Leucobacter sp. UT-8R-CII-1-4 TaxID=3040075 RepID=UPI0024A7B99A|nr:dihydrolipoamide acetyltransferase family protein [Leucobacter sp. UT-8R-CII-1-4]MDI6024362.1 dihydrolipoamide acetyltransferase family protein [Leucobacter sp. UT-8R-CII-1-4]
MIDVLMPRLSDTMTEGTIATWRKQVGDTVTAGEVLMEIETDKALMEQEAYEDGTLSEIIVAEGEPAPIGTLIARIDNGSGPEEAISAPDARANSDTSASATTTPDTRLLASPLVRKLARERGIDLAPIQGSGPGGRIVRADIEARALPATVAAVSTTDRNVDAQRGAAAVSEGDPVSVVPFDPIRQTIAKRLSESATTIPSFTVTSSADVTELLELRHTLNAALDARGEKLSVNDLIVRAVALALRAHPGVNASYTSEGVGATVLHSDVHIGVAMATAAGLVVPVIRNVDTQSVTAIAKAVKEMAIKAAERRLSPAEMSEGTFTVSNLGMFGVDQFDAIINPPQGAILAVGAARDELQLRDGAVVQRIRMSFTLTSDHRIIDGALAAQFLKELTALIETPMRVIA